MNCSKPFLMNALATLATSIFVCSCETVKPAPDSGFLANPELMKKEDKLPVQRVWKDPAAKMGAYEKIIIRPVKTDMQIDRTNREKRNLRNAIGLEDSDVAEFAKHTQEAFKKAIQKGPCRLALTEEPAPGVMALELSFVKIVPAKPLANAAKTALTCNPIGACFIPLKYAAKGTTDSANQSSIAIEGRLVDSVSGRTLAMFAQRNKQCSALLNVQDFSAYGNLEQIVDAWAEKFVEIVNKRPFETGEAVEGQSQWKFINF